MERMNGLDSLFIAIEDPINHMHIGSVGIFEGPAPSYASFRALVETKIPLVARYRQRVREAPASMGRPVWIDDTHFNLDYHLRHTALPGRADDDALERLVARVMSQPLDRQRPLWEMWMVEGVDDGRWALVSKVHHCMVDGIAGTDLLAALMDTDRDAVTVPPPLAWTPAGEPSRIDLMRDTAAEGLHSIIAALRGVGRALGAPADAVKRAANIVSGVARVGNMFAGTPSSLTGPIGPSRRWTSTEMPLADVKRIGAALGGTVNDVVLTGVTRGLRALLASRGEDLDGRSVTTLIPVSLRTPDARGTFDNRVGALIARLPVNIDDASDTLKAVREQMAELKQSHELEASQAVVGADSLAPPSLGAIAARTIVHGQEFVETVATNVPGPQFPLFVCGRRMERAYPYVPIAGHIRVAVAIFSYCGHVGFGITGDWDAAADIDVLAQGITDGLADLLAATS